MQGKTEEFLTKIYSTIYKENGKVDPTKLNAFVFDQFQNGYYKIGEKVGQAWKSGLKYMDK